MNWCGSFVISKLHKHRAAQRAAFQQENRALRDKQAEARRVLEHRHNQAINAAREVRALAEIEARELKCYEVSRRKQERIQLRQGA